MNDEPLIYTVRGNLPVSQLTQKVLWEDRAEYVKCIEQYWLADELVKQSVFVLGRKPLDLMAQQG